MNTRKQPTVRALAKALGRTPREIRKNFEALVFGALRFWSDSTSVRLCCDFTPALGANVRKSCPAVPPEELFRLYREAVQACPLWADVLGAVHALKLSTKRGESLGQCFKSEDLAGLVGMQAVDLRRRHPPKEPKPLRIYDPTAGAGSLLLAQAAEMREEASPFFLWGDDYVILADHIEPLYCAMTAVHFLANTLIHGRTIEGLVVRIGDPLTRDQKLFWVGVRGIHDPQRTETCDG